jgi:ketosteroid isomerase-like protein
MNAEGKGLMRIPLSVVLAASVIGLTHAPAVARQEKGAPEDPAHAELRKVRDEMTDAINKDDRAKLMSHLHKNIVVTFMDGDTVRGHDGVQKYFDSKLKGNPPVVQTYSVSPKVDELSIVYGEDTAIAFGGSDDYFKLSRGLEFPVHNRWTATLVKEDGKWLLAAFHASVGLFDNPLMSMSKRFAYGAAGGAGILGLLVGWLIGRRRRPAAGGAR